MNEKRADPNGGRRASDTCLAHSGLETHIQTLHESVTEVKKDVKKIFTRTNVVLGGICVSCILLAINIVIKSLGV